MDAKPGAGRGLWDRFEAGPVLTLAAILFVSATLIMLSEGINRTFRDISFFWAEESVRYLMVWAFFLTLGVAGRRGFHIRSELLVDHVPERPRRVMHFLSVIVGLLFSAALFSASLPQLVRYYTMGMMSESDLDIPQWVIFLAMPLGAALLFGYYARCLAVFLRGRDPYATHPTTGSEL